MTELSTCMGKPKIGNFIIFDHIIEDFIVSWENSPFVSKTLVKWNAMNPSHTYAGTTTAGGLIEFFLILSSVIFMPVGKNGIRSMKTMLKAYPLWRVFPNEGVMPNWC